MKPALEAVDYRSIPGSQFDHLSVLENCLRSLMSNRKRCDLQWKRRSGSQPTQRWARNRSCSHWTYYRLNDNGSISYRGFLWTAFTGMLPILDLLAEHGIDYGSDWRSIIPTAITADSSMILIGGQAADLTPGGFIIHITRDPTSAVEGAFSGRRP